MSKFTLKFVIEGHAEIPEGEDQEQLENMTIEELKQRKREVEDYLKELVVDEMDAEVDHVKVWIEGKES